MTNTTDATGKVKEILDYLHLYLGCECIIDAPSQGWREDNMTLDLLNTHLNRDHKITPILRPLSSMTEEEALETESWIQWTERNAIGMINGFSAEAVRKMCSKGFDLFGLIPSGLAIDKTKLP